MASLGVATRSKFRRYSFANQILIVSQCPHATRVAGFKKWLELDRCVRKGERSLRIFAPITKTETDD
jgi:hypothetical protein